MLRAKGDCLLRIAEKADKLRCKAIGKAANQLRQSAAAYYAKGNAFFDNF